MKKEQSKRVSSKKVNAKVGNRPSQAERVFDYLVDAGKKGATNFEMMVNLQICDVRKRISELNELLYEYHIDSEFEESKDGKRYKRYWAVPQGKTLEEFLNETKRFRQSKKKSTGGGFR